MKKIHYSDISFLKRSFISIQRKDTVCISPTAEIRVASCWGGDVISRAKWKILYSPTLYVAEGDIVG